MIQILRADILILIYIKKFVFLDNPSILTVHLIILFRLSQHDVLEVAILS